MDGYNQYPWNHCYDPHGMIYPPQHVDMGYDNWRNFDYNYHIQQVPSYYQDWSNNDASTFQEMVPVYMDMHYDQESDPRDGFEFHGAPEENYYDNERSFEYDYQMQQTSSHYQEWGSNEYWPPNDEEKHTIEDAMTRMEDILKRTIEQQEKQIEEQAKINEQHARGLKSLECVIGKLATLVGELTIVIKELQEVEDPIEDEIEDAKLFDKRDKEECPLMDISKNEQEDLEASKDELKSEMSISKPLNSSIYYFFDIDASIDFILPLDHFDPKKENEKYLGILEQKGEQWKKRMEEEQEERSLREICKKYARDWSSIHESLHDFEAQKLKYNGKEDRYPWPFR